MNKYVLPLPYQNNNGENFVQLAIYEKEILKMSIILIVISQNFLNF